MSAEADPLLGIAAGPVPDWTPTSRRVWQDTPWLRWAAYFALALAWGGVLASEVPAGDPAAHLAAYSTCNGVGAGRRLLAVTRCRLAHAFPLRASPAKPGTAAARTARGTVLCKQLHCTSLSRWRACAPPAPRRLACRA